MQTDPPDLISTRRLVRRRTPAARRVRGPVEVDDDHGTHPRASEYFFRTAVIATGSRRTVQEQNSADAVVVVKKQGDCPPPHAGVDRVPGLAEGERTSP